jgi:RES domain-containing protein
MAVIAAVRAVKWAPCWRVIPARYAEDRTLEKISDVGDLDVTDGLERMTGPGSDSIMAPFIYRNPEGSRFSDGAHGVYYAARTQATAVEETKHHRAVFMRRTKEAPMRLEMRVLTADLDGELHDIRGQQKKHPAIYHRSNYSASQAFGRQLAAEGSDGIVYDSVRHNGGQCAAVFRPLVLSRCRSAGLLAFDWNGMEVAKVYELKEYK